jgi:hypothetical protein
MVAMSERSRDARQTLLYNEQKLEQSQARFLGAFNYWQEDNQLTYDDKLHRLQQLNVLNERSQAKTVHISLNFHPGDELADGKMRQIAAEFLKEIDFAHQPALVYRHLDAGHPHMHVVTTSIRPDGSRITNDLRSPRHLMKICAGLEARHYLTPVYRGPKLRQEWSVTQNRAITTQRQSVQRVQYGQSPTKTSISQVLDHVLNTFAYTSLDELNAILSLYRVRADRGHEESLMYRSRGLYYRALDDYGRKIGAPIKASAFDQDWKLDYLEKRYLTNRQVQQEQLQRVRTEIDWTFYKQAPDSLGEWKNQLQREKLRVITPVVPVQRRRQQLSPSSSLTPAAYDGHGFFYVDFLSNVVFRDTVLGQKYTAEAILQRAGLEETIQRLVLSQELTLTPKDKTLFQQSDPEPAEKLRMLLRLSHQHDRIRELERQQTQKLSQRQGLRQSW